MTIVSTQNPVINHMAIPSDSFSQINYNALPVISKAEFANYDCEDAFSLLTHSAHVEGTFGSPGTILLTELENNVFEALVVNELGEITSTEITRIVNGWSLGKGKIATNFSSLSKELLSGLEDVMGSYSAIPYLTPDQITTAYMKLSQSEPGTYLAFAHLPAQETREEDHLISPIKRNVLFWVNCEGSIEEAHFHFDPITNLWRNGGPCATLEQEEVLSDATLFGLIQKKVAASGVQTTIYPLSLD